ncbi:RING finger protein 34 [Dissophora globulifera]|nr:RING finger protein 34 [Dissophora globulifera]
MSNTAGLAHSVPPLQTGAKSCARCDKDFHLFRPRKNCYNCGSMVCESCSDFRTRLPQFGYTQEVRCCGYCAHFLQVSRMDYASLSKLNIKTLRGYLLSYNIPTQGMLEKQDLIHAIQSYKPIPQASEVYFRQHLPKAPEKTTSLFEGLSGLGRPESPSGSSQESSSSSSGDGWLGDIDRFFSRLLNPEERAAPTAQTTRPARSHSQSQPQPQPQSYPSTQQHPPESSRQVPPQPRARAQPSPGAGRPNTAESSPYRPPSREPPATASRTRDRTGPSSAPFASYSTPSAQPAQPTPPRSTTAAASRTPPTSSGTRQPPSPSQSPTLTLEQVLSGNTDPSTLSIKTIKALLDNSFVSYVGVVEKRDLVDRLQKLIENTKAERVMVQEQEELSKKAAASPKASRPPAGGANEDDNLCKICCDAALNCVMLNCNHMSTCMDCGKLIMEGSRMCPICREYVVRLLHVFRA